MTAQENPTNESSEGAKIEAERLSRAKRLRHKIRETRRLVNQRFDELEAEAESLQLEKAG